MEAEAAEKDERKCDLSREEHMHARFSHESFIEQRDWGMIERIWKVLLSLQSPDRLPEFVRGYIADNRYGITDLDLIHNAGKAEFASGNPKFKRNTLAFCIGYLGSAYSGYQQQKGVEGIVTVEDDLDALLERKVVAAGRTDKGVSALSQIVSYATYDNVSPEDLLERMRDSDACRSGRLAVWDCKRVPRKFHPLFGATWRRYLYFFPLGKGLFLPHYSDIDIGFINDAFSRIEGRPLPFNGFAHRENRASEEGHGDICTLHRAKATVLNVRDIAANDDISLPGEKIEEQVMCIELVGDRFLRRMVRILVATVVRESVLAQEERNVQILYDIAVSRDRNKAAAAAPSVGLGLCGVGFDLDDLANMKNTSMKPAAVSSQSISTVSAAATNDSFPATNERNTLSISASRKKRKQIQQQKAAALQEGAAHVDEDSQRLSKRRTLPPPFTAAHNTATLVFSTDSNIVISSIVESTEKWLSVFRDELISYQPELLFQPERAFSFTTGQYTIMDSRISIPDIPDFTLVLPQSYTDVGTTIWDAETLLAHYLHYSMVSTNNSAEAALPRVLELGAGTGLAALTWLQTWKYLHGSEPNPPTVVVQEIPEVAEKLSALLSSQLPCGPQIQTIAGWWGEDFLQHVSQQLPSLSDQKFRSIIMADVLYHAEHFPALIETVTNLLAKHGEVIMVFEQRRKDLSELVQKLADQGFSKKQVLRYCVTRNSSIDEEDNTDQYVSCNSSSTVFYICHFTGYLS